MTDSDIKQFKTYVCRTLINRYHCSKYEAELAIMKSYMSKALEYDKDYVSHDTVDEWAKYIYEEMRCK